jgi:hypothetical protein
LTQTFQIIHGRIGNYVLFELMAIERDYNVLKRLLIGTIIRSVTHMLLQIIVGRRLSDRLVSHIEMVVILQYIAAVQRCSRLIHKVLSGIGSVSCHLTTSLSLNK